MMNMLESRRCLSSLGLGTPRVCEPKGQLLFLADSASLLLQADDWHQKELCCPSSAPCAAPLPLAWDQSSPGTVSLVPKALPLQAYRAVQSMAASWSQVYLQLCYPLGRHQNKGMCKPCPQSAFSFLRGTFLLFSPCHSRVP